MVGKQGRPLRALLVFFLISCNHRGESRRACLTDQHIFAFSGEESPSTRNSTFLDEGPIDPELDLLEVFEKVNTDALKLQLNSLIPDGLAVTLFNDMQTNIQRFADATVDAFSDAADVAIDAAKDKFLEHSFWGRPESLVRQIGDVASQFYLKKYGTWSEKLNYAIAYSCRFVLENPGKTAAILAGSAMVIGGIWHFNKRWKHSAVNITSNRQIQVKAAVIGARVQQGSVFLRNAVTDPSNWWAEFRVQEHRSAQRFLLKECRDHHASYAISDSASSIPKLEEAMQPFRDIRGRLDIDQLIAAPPDDANAIYPHLAPLHLMGFNYLADYSIYENLNPVSGARGELSVEISERTWNDFGAFTASLPQFVAFCQKSMSGVPKIEWSTMNLLGIVAT